MNCLSIDVRSRIANIMWRAKFKVKDIVDRNCVENDLMYMYSFSYVYKHIHMWMYMYM